MKFKVLVTIQEEQEWDTDWYEADTPEACAAEQKRYYADGEACPIDSFGSHNGVSVSVELLKAE